MSAPTEEPQKKAPAIKASRGLLVSCDGALKQFLLRLNENSSHKCTTLFYHDYHEHHDVNKQPFYLVVMRDLDEKHLFINSTRYPEKFDNIEQWLKHEGMFWEICVLIVATKIFIDELVKTVAYIVYLGNVGKVEQWNRQYTYVEDTTKEEE